MNLFNRHLFSPPRRLPVWSCLLTLLYAVAGVGESQFCFAQEAEEATVTVIRSDTVLDPRKTYGQLVIAASDITIDGRGAVIQGNPVLPPNQRSGVAISAKGVSGVTLKNVRAHCWETGLQVVDGQGWTIEDCDFSDNFHDPEYGWGENGRRGGIVLEHCKDCRLSRNRANRVWDGCVLLHSSNNKLIENNFSHTSNTCLKLWDASGNEIIDNKLTHGIRIAPGEVHARDSTGVLIESGSNQNRLIGNDCTHGGDGIFVRVLNGWCSTDNYFEANDCSYANNNGVECWAPRNTFVRNKANHCSYGFWLGGSDQTRLIDNEASFNGLLDGNHNSPHLPERGHAGVVFMFGPSSHILARGNRCEGNNGAGIALIGDIDSAGSKWRAYHWVLENNKLHENRWGIYARYAEWIRLAGNEYRGNQVSDLLVEDGVVDLEVVDLKLKALTGNALEGDEGRAQPSDPQRTGERPPVPRIDVLAPHAGVAGEPIAFRSQLRAEVARGDSPAARRSTLVDERPLAYEWQLGDGTTASSAEVEHTYLSPGFYRVGVNAVFAHGIELAYRDLVVVADLPELGTDANRWGFEAAEGLACFFQLDAVHRVAGETSVRCAVDPYHGGLVRLEYPSSRDAQWDMRGAGKLGFWLKAINPNMPGWQSNNPELTLHAADGRWQRFIPKSDLFSAPQASEAREGWRYIEVPLGDDSAWERTGEQLEKVAWLTIGFDSWDAQPLTVWIDGLVSDGLVIDDSADEQVPGNGVQGASSAVKE